MKSVHPYLNFDGNTEEVFTFYQSVFDGKLAIVRFSDMGDNSPIPEEDRHKIANVALPLAGDTVLMGSDILESLGHSLTIGNNFYITIEAESKKEAEELFNALSAGGNVEMPLQKTEWAEQYGICADKFGVQWMLNYTGEADITGSGEG